MAITRELLAVWVFIGAAMAPLQAPAVGSDVVFYYEQPSSTPVSRVGKSFRASEPERAILAVYALQMGTGCTGGAEAIQCELTETLAVDGQCSDSHIALVKKWFRRGIPIMGRYAPRGVGGRVQREPSLEGICYRTPDGATVQELVTLVRMKTRGNRVLIKVEGMWLARDAAGELKYLTEYLVKGKEIVVIRHRETLR